MPDHDQAANLAAAAPSRQTAGSAGVGHDQPSQVQSEVSVRLNQLLYRLDGLRDLPPVGALMAILLLAAAGALWWIGRPSQPASVELSIPMAAEAEAAEVDLTGAEPADSAAHASEGIESNGTERKDFDRGPDDDSDQRPAEDTIPEHVVVHVSGAVTRQGLVTVGVNSRIADAVAAAGGIVPGADLHRLNLAALVVDGQHIRVPKINEEPDGPLVEGGSVPDPEAVADPASVSERLVNINTADQKMLEALPGVGPATADAIVTWRLENGRFQSVDDLILVSGIGPAKLAAVRDRATT